MLVEFSLGDPDGFLKVFVRQRRVNDRVTGFLQEGWFAPADDAGSAVEGGRSWRLRSVVESYEN
jgi:hypothetical protein